MDVLSLAAINALDRQRFIERFADIAEHSPWVAEDAEQSRPFANRDAMITAFAQAIDRVPPEQQLTLLRAHPDLAGRAAIAGDLTDDSRKEQSGVGLDQLTPDEFTRFTEHNTRYQQRFGFPFIFAVRGATKDKILTAFEERVTRDQTIEFTTAIEQVRRIIRFRLEDQVSP